MFTVMFVTNKFLIRALFELVVISAESSLLSILEILVGFFRNSFSRISLASVPSFYQTSTFARFASLSESAVKFQDRLEQSSNRFECCGRPSVPCKFEKARKLFNNIL